MKKSLVYIFLIQFWLHLNLIKSDAIMTTQRFSLVCRSHNYERLWSHAVVYKDVIRYWKQKINADFKIFILFPCTAKKWKNPGHSNQQIKSTRNSSWWVYCFPPQQSFFLNTRKSKSGLLSERNSSVKMPATWIRTKEYCDFLSKTLKPVLLTYFCWLGVGLSLGSRLCSLSS